MVDEVRVVWQVSIRRICQALPVDRSTYHYRSKRTGQAVLTKRIREIEAPSNWWTPLLSSGGSGKVSNEPGAPSFYG
jgi:putative transposase